MRADEPINLLQKVHELEVLLATERGRAERTTMARRSRGDVGPTGLAGVNVATADGTRGDVRKIGVGGVARLTCVRAHKDCPADGPIRHVRDWTVVDAHVVSTTG